MIYSEATSVSNSEIQFLPKDVQTNMQKNDVLLKKSIAFSSNFLLAIKRKKEWLINVIFCITEAKAEISGPSEKYLKPGSGLRLQCNVVQSTEIPTYVFWYHNNRMINYDVDRGINVTTDLTAKTSTLSITSAATKHSGNYSCVPSNAQPASTYVHILNGKITTHKTLCATYVIIFFDNLITCWCIFPLDI